MSMNKWFWVFRSMKKAVGNIHLVFSRGKKYRVRYKQHNNDKTAFTVINMIIEMIGFIKNQINVRTTLLHREL